MMNSIDSPLIRALQSAALYSHPVDGFEVIETHISWVLLTGPYAYKIKKPVNLGFLDFSTLDKRHYYCEEEVRLNRRLAPELYLGIVAITGSVQHPELDGSGEAIEYAVRMVQFPQEAQLDRALDRGVLGKRHMDVLARIIADFHARIETAGADTPFGTPESVRQPVQENFNQIRQRLSDRSDLAALAQLQQWSEATFAAHREDFRERKRNGFIRQCHGDMHLRNMTQLDDQIIIFDCIEFNERLSWIDVMSEVAFLDMDLEDRGQPLLARRFLNAYLEITGDYGGLAVLVFYQVYRALVRAKVDVIRLGQTGLEQAEREAVLSDYRGYIHLAERYTRPREPLLMVTHGLSGSGKTYCTRELLEATGAIRLRSDIERKRLYGVPVNDRAATQVNTGIYRPEAGVQTYERLESLAGTLLEADYPVIVDAACLQRSQRDRFRRLAERLCVPYVLLDFEVADDTLRRRVTTRMQDGQDASDAGLEVLEHQLATQEPLGDDELEQVLVIETGGDVDFEKIVRSLPGP